MKSHLFLLASFLLATTCAAYVAKPPVPAKTAPPPPVLKAPPPPVAKPPTTSPPVAKPPTTAPPVAKPPTTAPPVVKPPPATPPTPPRNTKECYPLCVVRCKLHSRQNVCLRACVTCCDRCKCVPPGHYGNKEVCKCWANMKTHGGRPKCP
uniref:GASA-like protein n=1 Tax=Gerbera hybrida TaxID=18101 RepID=Q6Q766_GERHY|nr:GASA-like protein [Gerbera hybrid cultivar]